MRILTLMENTAGTAGCIAKHGLSLYAETNRHHLLFDTGQDEDTWKNAGMLGVDLSLIDTVVLSHGHYDHGGGLSSFAKINPSAKIYCHTGVFASFYNESSMHYIGLSDEVKDLPHIHMIEEEGISRLDEELTLFAGIHGRKLYPQGNRHLSVHTGTQVIPDSFSHEQCLVLESEGKRILFSGCAHNGIVNILERFHTLYTGYPDLVISGFHMKKSTSYTQDDISVMRSTAEYLKDLPCTYASGHCTGETAFAVMKEILGDRLIALHTGCEVSCQ